ncbi:hypothetical protein BDF22DRAFT_704191 [Syncephalis plumigaleata]|nr:hypothetical protein BDF22DRAFT_704191 [Syncephalis plumigaleata]
MRFLLKSLLPLLAAWPGTSGSGAGAGAGGSGTNGVPSAGASLNISEECQKVFLNKDLMPSCMAAAQANSNDDAKSSVSAICDANASARCSDDEINKSLDTLEASCKTELKEGNPSIQSMYTSLLTGKYCGDVEAGNKPEADGLAKCTDCSRAMMKAALAWKPPRSTDLAGDTYTKIKDNVNKSAEKCNVDASSSNSASTAKACHTDMIMFSALTSVAAVGVWAHVA